jgi:hypothetical protein
MNHKRYESDVAKIVKNLRMTHKGSKFIDCITIGRTIEAYFKQRWFRPGPRDMNDFSLIVRSRLGNETAESVLKLNAMLRATDYYAILEYGNIGIVYQSNDPRDPDPKTRGELPRAAREIVEACASDDEHIVFDGGDDD